MPRRAFGALPAAVIETATVSPMARNVEIKARVHEPRQLRDRIASVSDSGPLEMSQKDVFFHCATGRLKLRTFADGGAELIAYDRADQAAPGPSKYHCVPIADPHGLAKALSGTLGIRGVVLKRRSVYLTGRTRIHLDRVEGLGDFMELEVGLDPSDSIEEGQREANNLLERLEIPQEDLVESAYIDLLEASASDGNKRRSPLEAP